MSVLDTTYKRKSAVLTTIIGVVILLLIFFFGLTYLDPPEEYGIAVNFGTTDYGSGNVQPKAALKPASQAPAPTEEVEETPEEVVEETAIDETETETEEAATEPEASAEEVITNDNSEALAIKKREEEKKKREAEEAAEAERKAEADRKAKAKREAEAKRKAEEERKRREAEEAQRKKEAEQAAKRRNADALLGGFSDGDGKEDGGEGNDNKAGDKGQVTGDPNAKGYYGLGGTGSGGNYRLGNRNALTMPKPDYPCNEEGKVVVTISVDQSGKVISAVPGAKGTTNSASCLFEEAKEAALKTKFNADSNAPPKQVGSIIYNFSLSD